MLPVGGAIGVDELGGGGVAFGGGFGRHRELVLGQGAQQDGHHCHGADGDLSRHTEGCVDEGWHEAGDCIQFRSRNVKCLKIRSSPISRIRINKSIYTYIYVHTEAIDGGHASELGVADVLGDAEAADGESRDDVVLEVEESVALGPMEDREDIGDGGEEALPGGLLL